MTSDEEGALRKGLLTTFQKFWDWLETNKEQIKIVSVFAAGAFVIWEYLDYRYEQRIERSLEYVERLQNDENVKSRTSIDQFWISSKHEQIFKNHPNFDKEFLDYVDNQINNDEKYLKNVHRLYLLYKDISICTISDVCDLITACKAFWPEIQQFRHLHTKYIQKWNSFVHE